MCRWPKCRNSLFVESADPPTFFTPNGDDWNEYFIIDLIDQEEQVSLVVFDGLGKVVFQDADYRNTWNGLDQNGQELPAGSYYYMIDYGKGQFVKSYVLIER